jgi:hypothetical protein
MSALATQTRARLRAALTNAKAADEVADALEKVHGLTDGTAAASSVLIVDANLDLAGIRNLTLGVAGTTLGSLILSGNTSGTVTIKTAAAAGGWSMTLPADDGDAGEQLQTNGSGVCTWEAAGSMRAVKNVLGKLDDAAHEALARITSRSVYAFHYKENARETEKLPALSDTKTEFHGIMAEEYPEVMMRDGKIFNPINAFGELMLGIKALAQEVTSLKAQLAATKLEAQLAAR